MTPRRGGSFTRAVVLFFALSAAAYAQEAVTISGHVSADNHPVQGATVRIQTLNVGSTTDADGRYSFIVPSSSVRGQTVTITARYVRFSESTAQITLVGGTMVKDFALLPIGDRSSQASKQPVSAVDRLAVIAPTLDSTALDEIAGPVDLATALAGRVVGMTVTTASALGGSSPVILRGYRSIAGSTQPLFVINGIPVQNSNLLMPRQQFGLGGFDYGSAIQDFNPSDVAAVRVLRGAEAAALYGGRAANGVILVSTKSGRALTGFEVSASQQVTFESPVRLPDLQNAYGQGSGGRFAFFNGSGGGVNDSIAENWGPALAGQPIAQASLTEPKRADVRPWLAQPNNLSSYLDAGRTLKTGAAVQGSNGRYNLRASADRRDTRGLVPTSTNTRQGASIVAGNEFSEDLSVNAHFQYSNARAHNRPFTGFDATNPVADFMRMGRQVDISALESHVTDVRDDQISWNYTGHNNPYFAPNLTSNSDDRSRWLAGGSGSYAFSNLLRATVRAGTDRYNESRDFDIAKTWMGGLPSTTGRGDFSNGGYQRQRITASETNVDAVLAGAANGQDGLALSGGAGHRANNLRVSTLGSDKGLSSSASATPALISTGDATTTAVFASASFTSGFASLNASARNEWYSLLSSGNGSALYPSISGSFDLARAADMQGGSVSSARLRAGWSRSGGEISPSLLRSIFTANPATPVTASSSLGPEITSGFELGGNIAFFSNRLAVDLTVYNERTSDIVVGVPAGANSVVATNAATISNSGVETEVTMTPVRSGARVDWTIVARYAKNSNSVAELGAGTFTLGPAIQGLTVEAVKGLPLGALVGTSYRRDPATGSLLLQAGLPVPNTNRRVLGTMAPDWTGGLSSTLHVGAVELSALVDARMGGSVFSTTNMIGATSGTLAETAFRPDSGLLISGIDATTGKANTVHVSTEAYYHALREINERWVYSGNVIKLRDVRFSVSLPLRPVPLLSAQSLRISLIARNLAIWSKAPNIDPETALSNSSFQGVELGQLPTTRSIGLQLSIMP